MNLRQTLKQEQALQTRDSVTTTIFPLVEAWLQETTDHWNSFRALKGKRNADAFRSVMDFLFVGVFPSYRRACMAFYAGKEPPLRKTLKERERAYMERKILLFLEVSFSQFCEDRRVSWGWCRDAVEALVA